MNLLLSIRCQRQTAVPSWLRTWRTFKRGFLVATSLLIPAAASHASFGIMPMEVQQQLSATATRLTDDIELHNGSDQPLHISSSVVDWTLTRDGEYKYFEGGSQSDSCAKWIQLSPSQFILPPKKSLRVRYTITPTGAFDTERRAMIFFQSRPLPLAGNNTMGLQVSTRVGCKVIFSPPQALPLAAQISDIVLTTKNNRPAVRVSVQNTGQSTFRARGTTAVKNSKDQNIGDGDLSSAQVLPGDTRDLWFLLDKPLDAAAYKIEAAVDYGARDLIGGQLETTFSPAKAPVVVQAPPVNMPAETLPDVPVVSASNLQ